MNQTQNNHNLKVIDSLYTSILQSYTGTTNEINPSASVLWLNTTKDKAYEILFIRSITSPSVFVSNSLSNQFNGACIDTGATSSVIGLQQAKAYCATIKMPFKPAQSSTLIQFGAGQQRSMGFIVIRVPHPYKKSFYFELQIEAVDGNLPLLLGLNFMDLYKLYPQTVKNLFKSKHFDAQYNIQRRDGYLFINWQMETILYTKPELIKLHQHFFHPTASKLFNALQRSSPSECTSTTRSLLDEITKSCKTCAVFRPKPLTFQVAIPEEKDFFNQRVAIDLFWLDGQAKLHVVDIGIGFNSSIFINSHTVEAVKQAFIDCWVSIYIGFPSKMRIDQGSQFQSTRWEGRASESGIILKPSGVESHNSIGLGERYHAPLRRIYNKIRTTSSSLSKESVLRLGLKAMNDTAAPNGLVPSLLVFGVLPRLPIANHSFPDQVARMNVLQIARKEMETVVAQLRVRQALNSRIPAAANMIINPGDSIYVFRETDRRYHGPHRVLDVQDKQIFNLVDNKRV